MLRSCPVELAVLGRISAGQTRWGATMRNSLAHWLGGMLLGGALQIASAEAGTLNTLYSFGSKAGDGAAVAGDLVAVNGTLYGTTFVGPGPCPDSKNCGTVFSY